MLSWTLGRLLVKPGLSDRNQGKPSHFAEMVLLEAKPSSQLILGGSKDLLALFRSPVCGPRVGVTTTEGQATPLVTPVLYFLIVIGVPVNSRVSSKIQQLLNTLKRPKRPPLKEFFVDDFEELLEGNSQCLALDPGLWEWPAPEEDGAGRAGAAC